MSVQKKTGFINNTFSDNNYATNTTTTNTWGKCVNKCLMDPTCTCVAFKDDGTETFCRWGANRVCSVQKETADWYNWSYASIPQLDNEFQEQREDSIDLYELYMHQQAIAQIEAKNAMTEGEYWDAEQRRLKFEAAKEQAQQNVQNAADGIPVTDELNASFDDMEPLITETSLPATEIADAENDIITAEAEGEMDMLAAITTLPPLVFAGIIAGVLVLGLVFSMRKGKPAAK